jgi:hypothetical protein
MDFFNTIASALGDLGFGIASNAAYDFLKQRFAGRTEATVAELQEAIGEYLILNGVRANAATVMQLLASKGYLQVTGSQLHAADKLSFGAASGAKFTVGHNMRTSTDKTAIEAGHGAFITGSGAGVVQNADGSISFNVGKSPSDGISVRTSGKK